MGIINENIVELETAIYHYTQARKYSPKIIDSNKRLGFLHYKKKLPFKISNAINLILNFEISKKVAIIIGLVILSIYIGLSIPELLIDERDQWSDYVILESALEIWPSTDSLSVYIKEQNTRYVRMILLDFSQEFFQNIKILPFTASCLLYTSPSPRDRG